MNRKSREDVIKKLPVGAEVIYDFEEEEEHFPEESCFVKGQVYTIKYVENLCGIWFVYVKDYPTIAKFAWKFIPNTPYKIMEDLL